MIINPAWFRFEDQVRRKVVALNEARGSCEYSTYYKPGGPALRDYLREISGQGDSGPRPTKFLPLADIGSKYFFKGASVCADGTPVLRQHGYKNTVCMGREMRQCGEGNMKLACGTILEVDDELNCQVKLSIQLDSQNEDRAPHDQTWVGWLHASLLMPEFRMDECISDCYEDRESLEDETDKLFEIEEDNCSLSISEWVWCDYPKVVEQALQSPIQDGPTPQPLSPAIAAGAEPESKRRRTELAAVVGEPAGGCGGNWVYPPSAVARFLMGAAAAAAATAAATEAAAAAERPRRAAGPAVF
jgi:hypothetical protein